jgi:predicted transcriptional regulator YdeE
MENFTLNEEIKVMCVAAESFPDGIAAAHQKLDAIAPVASDRRHFGISWGDGSGGIIYRAAAEEKEAGEAEKLGLEKFTIKSGQYLQETVENFMQNIPKVGETFKKLLAQPGVDPEGYCLEWYLNYKDMKCMVKLGA